MKQLLIATVLLLCTLTSKSQSITPAELVKNAKTENNFKQVEFLTTLGRSEQKVPDEITEYQLFDIDARAINELLISDSKNITFNLAKNDRESFSLELVEVELPLFLVKSAPSMELVKYQGGKHYRGIVRGDDKSIAAISIYKDQVMGLISESNSKGNWVFGKLEDSQSHILYSDPQIMDKFALGCETEDTYEPYERHEIYGGNGVRALTDCVGMYFEVDYDIYQSKGSSVTNTTDYVTGLYNQVATLYAAESINTNISEIVVWSQPSPYNGSSSSVMLNQFAANTTTFNGDIAMLLSYQASGGIAYVNGLCSSSSTYKKSFSSIDATYQNVPTYSWSVMVVTHEFGHLLGSQHTHACVWNGNNTAIDGCYTTEGGCPDPGNPSGGGTVMSYCHLTSVGINLNNGFGPQPGNVIRSKVTNASCLQACNGNPPPPPPVCTENEAILNITLDNYPAETTWTIKDAGGITLYSGGPYSSANALISVTLCEPNGCYDFTINDSYGDGICCAYGQGEYEVVFNGSVLITGGQFTSIETKQFCLSGAGGPTCTDGIQNGNETGVDCGGPDCPACPTCTDGIQNGDETGVDCGGSCGLPIVSITGPNEICINNSTNLSPSTGGVWTSSNNAVATVSNAGVVTGVSAGSVTFTFTSTGGCASLPTGSILVNPIPAVSITGPNSLCIGATTALSPSTGGVWTTGFPTILSVNNSGVVTALSTGVGTCKFTSNATGCASLATDPITVTTACATCTDGIQNGDETGIDCGGSCPNACATCTDGVQNGNETGVDCGGPDCAACPTCTDGIQNGDETGIDCGGSCPNTCATCSDGIQNGNETGVDCGGPACVACATCTDGIQNGNETGIDCGGPDCAPCNGGCSGTEVTVSITLDNYPGETTWNLKNANGVVIVSGGPYGSAGSTISIVECLPNGCYDFTINDSYGDGICCAYGQGSYTVSSTGTTHASGGQFGSSEVKNFCIGGGPIPTCTDGVQNGNETGIDCGGPDCPACPTCTDGIQNGNETGVDCGGPACAACATCSDGIQNGNETGVDCGGPDCAPCGGGGSTVLSAHYFETGWDGWADGGSDCYRNNGSAYAFEGNYSIRLRDNSGVASSMSSPQYNLTTYNTVAIQFHFYPVSMETGESLLVRYYNGSVWTTIATYVSGTDFNNNIFYTSTITLNSGSFNFSTNSQFRFQCDGSTNSDLIYMDAITVTGSTGTNLIESLSNIEAQRNGIALDNSNIVSVRPNPSSDYINITIYDEEEVYGEIQSIDVFDMMGRNVISHRNIDSEHLRLDVTSLATGAYILRINTDGEEMLTQKFQVMR